jgi:hypothetical protein
MHAHVFAFHQGNRFERTKDAVFVDGFNDFAHVEDSSVVRPDRE